MFGSAMQMTGNYSIDFDLLTEPAQKQQLHHQLQIHQQQQQHQQPQQLQLQHQPQLQLHQAQHHHQQNVRFSDAVVAPTSYSLAQTAFPAVDSHHVHSLHQQQPQQHLQQQQHLQLHHHQQQQQFQPAVPVAFHQYAARGGVGHPGFVGHLDSLYAIAQPLTSAADLQQPPPPPPHHLLVSQHPQHLMQQHLYQQPQSQQCSIIGHQTVVENDACEADSDSSRDDSAVGGAVTAGIAPGRSAASRRPGSRVPDDLKSDAYWKRRVRNNLSAKKSREKKRVDERVLSQQFSQLSEEVYADLLVYCALQRCRDLLGGPEMRRRRALERPPYLEEIDKILYYEGICYGLREAFRNKGLPMRALLPWRQACEDLNTWTDRRFIAFVGEHSAGAGQVAEEAEELQQLTDQPHQQQQQQQHHQTSAYFSVSSQMLSREQQPPQQQQQSGAGDRLKYSPVSAAAY